MSASSPAPVSSPEPVSSPAPAPAPAPAKEEAVESGLFKDIDNMGKLFMLLLGGSALILFMLLFYALLNMGKTSMSGGITNNI